MIHRWSNATDSSVATLAKVILYDYRKAFDLIDHNILVKKINDLPFPRTVTCWVVDLLTNRYQGSNCLMCIQTGKEYHLECPKGQIWALIDDKRPPVR